MESANERFLRSCIRERWKGASEFMFWGCFSYDKFPMIKRVLVIAGALRLLARGKKLKRRSIN